MSDRALDNLAREASERLEETIGFLSTCDFLNECESPIERALFVAFEVHGVLHQYRPIIGLPTEERVEEARRTKTLPYFIKPQWEVSGYRADFLIGFAGAGKHTQTSIIVECDGHQWHEKTKEQAQRDKERDRALQSHVAKVIRFTGSEIHRHPLQCAEEAFAVLDACLFAWVK